MMRLVRRLLRRYGLDITYAQVICPEHLKTISIDATWRADVVVQRALVFLQTPDPGDLSDVMPVDPDVDDSAIHDSPDSREIGRRRRGRTTRVYWSPKAPIVPFAIYVHQHGWSSPGVSDQVALYTELRCEVRTGIIALEITAPITIETAVAFQRPRWRRLGTERSLVKYALTQLDSQPQPPVITDDGQRVQWRLAGPKVGDRYVCVIFGAQGMTQWEKRLRETSLSGRVKRLIQFVAPA